MKKKLNNRGKNFEIKLALKDRREIHYENSIIKRS